jgi:hypothetical protein
VNQLLSRDEPSFTGQVVLTNLDLALAFNWYSQNKKKEHAQKYLADYCKTRDIKVKTQQIESTVDSVGFVCRMISRGATLDKKSLQWLERHLYLLNHATSTTAFDEPTVTPIVAPVKPSTIQDRLKAKSSKCIGLLEGAVDQFILSDFKKVPNTLELMRENGVLGAHGPNVVNVFKSFRDEFRLAIAGKDEQLNEGYSNYTEAQMKKMEALYDQIISDVLTIMGDSIAAREPRAKKPKSPEQQVKTLKICEEDTDLKIKSIPPTRMVGAEGVWTYHRKSRLLSYYVADDASGLGVKGCALLNYSKSKSRTKKLRKPEAILPQIISGGKVQLKKIMDELTTKDVKVTGRLNKETLLIRVMV